MKQTPNSNLIVGSVVFNARLPIFCFFSIHAKFKSGDKKKTNWDLTDHLPQFTFQRNRKAELGSFLIACWWSTRKKQIFIEVCLCWDRFFSLHRIFFLQASVPLTTDHSTYNLLFLSATRLAAVIFSSLFVKWKKVCFVCNFFFRKKSCLIFFLLLFLKSRPSR